jgi:tetratricopeptide (TPR) repeat protein
MPPPGESPKAPLNGETLFLIGRVHGLTRRRLEQLVRARGGRLAAKPGGKVTLVAFGNSAAALALPDGRLRLPAGLPATAAMMSERELRRRLGLLGPPEQAERSYSVADLERIAGLARPQLACLALFDVLEAVDERYAYRDLVAAREAGRLIARGIGFRQIVEAAIALRRRGNTLAEARLTEGASGALVRELGGQIAELSGQLTMRLDEAPSVDELVAAAEAAEEEGDLATAESLYATALRADPTDPVLPFNLGNIYDQQGRAAEAKIAWQIAVARDPALAEAWYNLAIAAEDEEQMELAVAEYQRAVRAQPDYADAQFNLALLLTKLDRCAEALPVWERFLALASDARQAATARRAAALCRMHLQTEQVRAG